MIEHRCNKVLNYASHDFITNFTYRKHLYFFHREPVFVLFYI